MKIINGSNQVPVIYTAHHASHDFGIFDDRVELNPEQKVRFSDYGTDLTIPTNGLFSIIADKSRALGDLNRDPTDPGRFQEQDYTQPTRNNIWKPNKELTNDEKHYCQTNFYQPFHNEIVNKLKSRVEPTFVVAWDNTAHYLIGDYTNGKHDMMRPFILSNRGKEGTAEPTTEEPTSCDPELLRTLAKFFSIELKDRGLPNEVLINFVMKGGYICRRYSTLRNKTELQQLGISCFVQSLQLEYDTIITHDQITLEPKPDKMKNLKEAFSTAIEKAIKQHSFI